MIKKGLTLVLCSFFALFAAVPAAIAQEKTPELAEVWNIEPAAGHSKDFYAGVKAHMAFRLEQGDPRRWQAYTPLLGDEISGVAVRYCCVSWADVDAYRAWDDAHPQVGQHFQEHVGPHIGSVSHYFQSVDWSNSHWSDAKGPWRLFAVTEYQVEPEDAADFDQAKEKMSQIALEQGWASDDNLWLWMSTIGGSPLQAIVLPYRDFAGMERGDDTFMSFLVDKLGSAEAAGELVQDFLGATEGSTFQIWEHQPELSMPE